MNKHPMITDYFTTLLNNHNMNLTLHSFFDNTLREHAKLVASGIPSQQALNIIIAPMEVENLKEALLALSPQNIEDLIYALRENLYHVSGKKSVYGLGGIIYVQGEPKVVLIDKVLHIDSIELHLEELPAGLKNDLLKEIGRLI